MEIKDLKANAGNIDLVVEVVTKESPRSFDKFGKKGQVCNAKVKDGSGQIVLTLWNEQVDEVKVGDRIHIANGWCSEYRGEKQVSTGRNGKIEVVSAGMAGAATTKVLTNDPNMLKQVRMNDDGDDDDNDDDSDETETVDDEEAIE